MSRLPHLSWPWCAVGDAIDAVAERTGAHTDAAASVPPPLTPRLRPAVLDWLRARAHPAELGVAAIDATYEELEARMRIVVPAIWLVSDGDGDDARCVVVVGEERGRLCILAPDRKVRSLPAAELRAAVCARHELRKRKAVQGAGIVDALRPQARARATDALVRSSLRGLRVRDGFALESLEEGRLVDSRSVRALGRSVARLLAVYGGAHALLLLAWAVLGRAALSGQLDAQHFIVWALVLGSLAFAQVIVMRLSGTLAIRTGLLLKRRVLRGALRLDPQAVRAEGAGSLLARAFESSVVETLAVGGGIASALAVVEISMTGWVLCAGAGGMTHGLALAAWTAVAVGVAWVHDRRYAAWTDRRLQLSAAVTDGMLGHKTRLAQQSARDWHAREDRLVERYTAGAQKLDGSAAALRGVVPRGWLVVSLVILAPVLVAGEQPPAALAVALGGVLLAAAALSRLVRGIGELVAARAAWTSLRPLEHAASHPTRCGVARALTRVEAARNNTPRGTPLIEARGLEFGWPGRTRRILSGVDFTLSAGDQVVVEGRSGAGKSTLVALLAGLREPSAGVILARGLDAATLGEAGWRRVVAHAPQFHENHLLTGSLAFNLLLGRMWPATHADLDEAEAVCRELGLGDLLGRMPSGIMEVVGDSGWQLSHGERSRVFIARALLQSADVVVLDESLASLDPETLDQGLTCVRRRAHTLVVVAHP